MQARVITTESAITARAGDGTGVYIPTEPGTVNKELLILAYYYPPDNLSGAMRPARFSRYIGEHGYSVHIIAGTYSQTHSTARVTRVPRERPPLLAQAISASAELLERFVFPYPDRLSWAPFALAAADLRRRNTAVVLSTSPPIATHITASILKRLYGIPWVADFRDPMLGNPFRNRRIGRLYDRVLERSIVQRADAVIVNTDTCAAMLYQRYPDARDKIHLIWNGYDPEEIVQHQALPERPYRVVTHAGAIYGQRNPAIFLSSLERLIDSGVLDPATIRVELIGTIELPGEWMASRPYSTLLQRGCLHCKNQWVSQREARDSIASTDYLLLLDMNGLGADLQVPGKLFEYLHIGRPILAFTAKASPVERILHQSGVPYRCVYTDSAEDDMDRTVLEFLSLPSDAVPATKWFYEQFDGRSQARILASVLDSVLTRRSNA